MALLVQASGDDSDMQLRAISVREWSEFFGRLVNDKKQR